MVVLPVNYFLGFLSGAVFMVIVISYLYYLGIKAKARNVDLRS